jgi:hypothetical protein
MRVFAEIAGRYGVNTADEQAVDHFYAVILPKKPRAVQQRVADELLNRDGEPDNELRRARVKPSRP